MFGKVTFRILNSNANKLNQFGLGKIQNNRKYCRQHLQISNSTTILTTSFENLNQTNLRSFSDLNKHSKYESEENPIEEVHKPLIFKQIVPKRIVFWTSIAVVFASLSLLYFMTKKETDGEKNKDIKEESKKRKFPRFRDRKRKQLINEEENHPTWSSRHLLNKLYIFMATTKNPTLNRQGARGLANLSENCDEATASRIIYDGGLDALREMIDIGNTNKQTQTNTNKQHPTSEDDSIRLNTVRAIANLSSKVTARDYILDDGWLHVFCEIASKNSTTTSIKQNQKFFYDVSNTLFNLSRDVDLSFVSSLFENEFSNCFALTAAFVCDFEPTEKDKQNQQRRAESMLQMAKILGNLSKTSENARTTLVNANFLESYQTLKRAEIRKMSKYSQLDIIDENILVTMCESLSEFAKTDRAKSQILNEGWIDFLELCGRTSNSANLRLHTAKTLSVLMQNDEIAISVLRRLGVDFFVSLTSIADLDVKHVVTKIIEDLKRKETEPFVRQSKKGTQLDESFQIVSIPTNSQSSSN